MRHPSSAKRAAQFMFASPRSAKQVRTFSCAKACARMSYTRSFASPFIRLLFRTPLSGPRKTGKAREVGRAQRIENLPEFRRRRPEYGKAPAVDHGRESFSERGAERFQVRQRSRAIRVTLIDMNGSLIGADESLVDHRAAFAFGCLDHLVSERAKGVHLTLPDFELNVPGNRFAHINPQSVRSFNGIPQRRICRSSAMLQIFRAATLAVRMILASSTLRWRPSRTIGSPCTMTNARSPALPFQMRFFSGSRTGCRCGFHRS